jgi:hypothetical protein
MQTKGDDNFVYEKPTGLEIPVNSNPKVAKQIMRNLNMGGGFDGFTPTFFTWKGLETK